MTPDVGRNKPAQAGVSDEVRRTCLVDTLAGNALKQAYSGLRHVTSVSYFFRVGDTFAPWMVWIGDILANLTPISWVTAQKDMTNPNPASCDFLVAIFHSILGCSPNPFCASLGIFSQGPLRIDVPCADID